MNDQSLPTLEPADFAAFLKEVHGFEEPFPWHSRLLADVIANGWPESIAVPTGLGKTGVLDIAVFSLALQAQLHPEHRTAPTRAFFVIDRRLVVDDVTAHAERIQHVLNSPKDSQLVSRAVAKRLGAIAHRRIEGFAEPTTAAEQLPLAVTKMRGGTSWAARWIRRPEQPAIVVGTVDQIGSRALFRGYGVTPNSRPIDAALVCADSLIILDEAHLAEPMRVTLTRLLAWETAVGCPVLPRRPVRLVTMSATLRTPGKSFTFNADIDYFDPSTGRLHEDTKRRFEASKTTTLWDASEVITERATPAERRSALADTLALAATRVVETDQEARIVGLVANTVATARKVHELLVSQGRQAELLIGRVRDVDRDILLETLLPKIKVGRTATEERQPLYVVATQTIEVGVNLDFDALVSEAAPIDALAQRLGRLDRLGHRAERKLQNRAIFVFAEALHKDDPIYGAATINTWNWLSKLSEPKKATKKRGLDAVSFDGTLDLSPKALSARLSKIEPSSLFGPKPRIPSLLPHSMLRSWAQTSPTPRSDMDIDPFLHGDQPVLPTINLVWRADLDRARMRESVEESLAARPVQAQEQVELPIYHLRQFLDDQFEAAGAVADTEQFGASADTDANTLTGAVRLTSSGKVLYLRSIADLVPGDIVLLRSEHGGLDQYGWNPSVCEPVIDVADLCRSRAGLRVRVDPRSLGRLSPRAAEIATEWLAERRRVAEEGEADRPDAKSLAESLLAAVLEELSSSERNPFRAGLASLLSEMLDGRTLRLIRVTEDRRRQTLAEIRWVLAAPARREERQGAILNEEFFDDDDDTASLTGQISLDQHTQAVAAQVRSSATRLGLPKRLIDALNLAAMTHDAGKADPRFQRMLRGGGEWSFLPGDKLLAKSGMDPADKAAWRRAREASGWPSGLRHEALSVALINACFGCEPKAEGIDLELVRHLVSVHHGFNRPLFDPVPCASLVPVKTCLCGTEVEASAEALASYVLDWTAPDRMARLIDRYGAWGLALMETILRLADQACSEAGT
jgi:CRISPR-associated endonuclease/helicase Cas3